MMRLKRRTAECPDADTPRRGSGGRRGSTAAGASPGRQVLPTTTVSAPCPVLRSRLAGPRDAAACASWLVAHMPIAGGAAQQLQALLCRLTGSEQLKALLIEAEADGPGEWAVVAVSLSGFLAPAETERVLADPAPFVMARALERALAGVAVFLDTSEVGRANAGAGLDLVVEHMQASWDFAVPIWRQVAAMAHDAYKIHHRGYRLNRALQEGWSEHASMYLDAGYRADRSCDVAGSTLDRLPGRFGTRRTLFYADRAVVCQRAPGLPAAYAFQYTPPRCRFSSGEQRILRSAAEGLTDREIAEELGLSLNAIKLAWRSIQGRVQDKAAHVLGDGPDGADGRRGPEKRRRVLAYVRDNPEELRPYIDR